MTVAEQLAKYAFELSFEKLPKEVVHQTKRLLIDTLGCALGGYPSDASRIVQQVARELGGPAECTIIGSGLKTSCFNAALANGAMVRFLDYNDVSYLTMTPPQKLAGHPSEVIPGAMAIGEREHSSGKDLLAVIVLGYELSAHFLDAITGLPLENRGWNNDSRAGFIMPLVAGKLLGLTEAQLAHAVGISGSHNVVLEVLDATGEEYCMAKNLRFPLGACGGIMAALLARRGLTGPARVIEGHGGFAESVVKGDFDVERLIPDGHKFMIMDTAIKSITADYTTQGHLTATLTLVKEHNIRPEDVASVRVRTGTRCAWHTGDPVKRYPTNKETADHSSYYLTAMAILDRALGPEQFSPEKYYDPRVRELIDKVTIEGDEELDRVRPAGSSEITTKQGATYRLKVEHPKGHPLNPMTDREVEGKFRRMAAKFMGEEEIRAVFDIAWHLEDLDDVGKLVQSMVFRSAPPGDGEKDQPVNHVCLRCGYGAKGSGTVWQGRVSHRPAQCPRCKSPYWDKPRQIHRPQAPS